MRFWDAHVGDCGALLDCFVLMYIIELTCKSNTMCYVIGTNYEWVWNGSYPPVTILVPCCQWNHSQYSCHNNEVSWFCCFHSDLLYVHFRVLAAIFMVVCSHFQNDSKYNYAPAVIDLTADTPSPAMAHQPLRHMPHHHQHPHSSAFHRVTGQPYDSHGWVILALFTMYLSVSSWQSWFV